MAREPKTDPGLKVVQHISSGSFSWEEAQKNSLKVPIPQQEKGTAN
jgi:hypothetical protein